MVCFYIGDPMIGNWTPDASLAPYISFDPRTGVLTFKPPRDETSKTRPKIMIDLTLPSPAAKKAAGPSPPPAEALPRATMSETTQLYTLTLRLDIPDGANAIVIEQSMGIYDWNIATPVAFLSNKTDKKSEATLVLESTITKALLPHAEWRLIHPFPLGQKWLKDTTSLLHEDNFPKVTALEAEAEAKKEIPKLNFLPLGARTNYQTYNLQKDDGRIVVSTFMTQEQGFYVAFAVHVSKKKKELQQLAGIYIFTQAINQ